MKKPFKNVIPKITHCKTHGVLKSQNSNGTWFCRPCNTVAMKKRRASPSYKAKPVDPLYWTWRNIKDRTKNSHDPRNKDYSGRDIQICERWSKSFENFKNDMGQRPSPNYSVERRDNNGDYCPENCYWATPEEQARNKRNNRYVECNGKEMIVADAAIELGMTYNEAYRFFKVRKNITESDEVECRGKVITLRELSDMTGIFLEILLFRAKTGRRVEYLTSSLREYKTHLYKGNYYTVTELAKIWNKSPSFIGVLIEVKGLSPEEAMLVEMPKFKNGELWRGGGVSTERMINELEIVDNTRLSIKTN